jgi:hypothetical protein
MLHHAHNLVQLSNFKDQTVQQPLTKDNALGDDNDNATHAQHLSHNRAAASFANASH